MQHFVTQRPHKGSTLMYRYPTKPKRLAGQQLMVGERSPTRVERPQGCQIRRIDAEFRAEVAKQYWWQDTERIQ